MNQMLKLAIPVMLLMMCISVSSAQSIEIRAEDGSALPDNIFVGETFTVLITENSSPIGANTSVAFTLLAGGVPIYSLTDESGKARYLPLITGTLSIRVLDDDLVTVANATVTVGAAEPPTLVTYTITNTTIIPPQTTSIDVRFSEQVSAIIKIEDASGNLVNELYSSSGVTDPSSKTWGGTYTNGAQVPDGEYTVNVSGVSTTTGLSVVDTSETITVLTQVPDLIVESITPNCGGYLFGNESNNISAVIENNGTGDAGASYACFVLGDGHTETVTVSALAAGANETVTITDPTIRNAGDVVTITVTADCNGEVDETNETNNVTTLEDVAVVNNGYKGKTYTGGSNITTVKSYDLNGDLVYSVGDSYYLSGSGYPDWTAYDVAWTASDLTVTGTVREARLYVMYVWDKDGVMPGDVSMSFNGVAQTQDAHYWDEKMFATSYPYGMLVYNVTDDFNTGGNIANLTNSHIGGDNVSMRGMLLVVVCEDASEPRRLIYLNEEFDLLCGRSSQCTTPEEATAWAPITGSIEGTVANATLITVAPGADGPEGELIFNGQVWTDVWNYAGSSQIGIDERDVASYLESTDNLVGFQSSGDYMEASNAFLVVTVSVSDQTGDIDGSGGEPTMSDAVYLAKHVVGLSGYETIDADGDIDGSGGEPTMSDAVYLAKHVVGLSGYETIY